MTIPNRVNLYVAALCLVGGALLIPRWQSFDGAREMSWLCFAMAGLQLAFWLLRRRREPVMIEITATGVRLGRLGFWKRARALFDFDFATPGDVLRYLLLGLAPVALSGAILMTWRVFFRGCLVAAVLAIGGVDARAGDPCDSVHALKSPMATYYSDGSGNCRIAVLRMRRPDQIMFYNDGLPVRCTMASVSSPDRRVRIDWQCVRTVDKECKADVSMIDTTNCAYAALLVAARDQTEEK